ncbi:TetR/AcrR family transcriptional regulator [Curtobacterium sp. MCSS17_008]|uniref:TetR/AcrR family transcriptional regulator n=1 Tax=Curtobacterium sp. MCSS17_008 TaxID=2175647 RepID=UPI000DA82BE4|nr:TetR family transcriptional regulator [Curtobacterium sp. MCSS17_008]PZF58834.1 TetR/AcrR family transcriptional regulator [Curtobacterium sp. MCSS17_008]
MFENAGGPVSKRDRTRARIREVALRSLREQGYDGTTMRGIAAAAGLSVGNAYYHFPTKDHLVQELYVEVQHQHVALAEPALEGVDDLTDRVGVVVRTGLSNLSAWHTIAPQFLTTAIAPDSPNNPFSAESAPARDAVLGLFDGAVSGARTRLPDDLQADLPRALWTAYLLVTLFWVYDTSPGQRRTERLVDAALGILRFALPMLRVPPFRRSVTRIVGIVAGRDA